MRPCKAGRAELRVDQAVLQPPQGRLRIQQAVGRGHQPGRVRPGPREARPAIADWPSPPPRNCRSSFSISETVRRSEVSLEFASSSERSSGRSLPTSFSSAVNCAGRGLEIGLGHLHRLVQFVDHALGLGVADLLQMELQLAAQRRTERRGPAAVLVADLQVEDLRGCRTPRPWAGRFSRPFAGPRRRCRWARRRAGHDRPEGRLPRSAALSTPWLLDNSMMVSWMLFRSSAPRNLPGSVSPPTASLRTIRACEACQVLGATRA